MRGGGLVERRTECTLPAMAMRYSVRVWRRERCGWCSEGERERRSCVYNDGGGHVDDAFKPYAYVSARGSNEH